MKGTIVLSAIILLLCWSGNWPYALFFIAGVVRVIFASLYERAAAVSVLRFVFAVLTKSDSAQRYSVDHVLLNLPDSPPTWMNMGIWSGAPFEVQVNEPHGSTFTQACRAMASRLAEIASLQGTDVVLDVGVGCGDQDMEWIQQRRCAKIVGVNIVESQVRAAQTKSSQLGLDSQLLFLHGSATELPSCIENEAVAARFAPRCMFDKVLCLDSAYHFNPRSKFFHDAYKLLKPGGVLALVDIVFVPSSQFLRSTSLLQQLIFKIAQSMLGLPTSNLLNESEYESSLANVGFEAIRINPVDHSGERTFKPLVKHIKTIVATYEAILNPLIIAKYNAVAFCFESLATKGWFRFVEVSAKRPW